jgi:hypothetical protein
MKAQRTRNEMSDQPKMTVLTYGRKVWVLNGKRHRTDGPATEWADGRKEWWLNGNLHRTDGPAVEMADGRKEWWLNDKQVSWREVYRQANDPEIELKILSYVFNFLT